MKHRPLIVKSAVYAWVVAISMLIFSASAVVNYRLGHLEPTSVPGFDAWVPSMLGPSSEVLRTRALADIRLALEQLSQPTSTTPSTEIRAYTQKLVDAQATLRRAARTSAADSRSLQALALVQIELQLLAAAAVETDYRPLLELARHRRPRDVAFQLDVAATYLRIGDADTALMIASELVRANTGVGRRAVALFDGYDIGPVDIVASLGESPGVVLALRTSFSHRGLLADYMSALERTLSSASVDVISEYGDVGEQTHQWKRVRAKLEGLEEFGKPAAESCRLGVLARASFAEGDLVGAETYARRAVSGDPANARLHELLADCLGAQEKNEEALESLGVSLSTAVSGVTSNGQRGRLYRKMGEAYERQGRGDRAFDAYRRAVELVPQDATASERLRFITRGQERTPSGS